MLELIVRFFITDKIVKFVFSRIILKFKSKQFQLGALVTCLYVFFFIYQKLFLEKSFY